MVHARCGSMSWGPTWLAAVLLAYGCGPGTPPPPFSNIDSATPAQLMAACTDTTLHFLAARGDSAEVAPGVRVRIAPESLSYRNSGGDLLQGRVIAQIQLLQGASFDSLGLTDTMPACWFISGHYPDHLRTTIISRNGERLKDSVDTYAKFRFHLRAEAHWLPDSGETEAFDLRPSELHAQDSTPSPRTIIKPYGQASCTNHGCCITSKPSRLKG